MKHSYRGVLLLCAVLMLNIVFTQYLILYFYYQKYVITLFLMLGNMILFPIALWIYKKEKDTSEQRSTRS